MSQVDRPGEDFDDSFDEGDEGSSRGRGAAPIRPSTGERGLLTAYKPEQGRNVRMGTLIGLLLLVAWGGKYLFDQLNVFEGPEGWRLLITHGIPTVFAVVLGSFAYWASYVHPVAGEFMIATEGEMKKVNWSSRKEVIGSTKVVIVVTFLLALAIFVVDIAFQYFFTWIGILKVVAQS